MLPNVLNFILLLMRIDSTVGTIKSDWSDTILKADALEAAIKSELTDPANPVLTALSTIETDLTLDAQYLAGGHTENLFNGATRTIRFVKEVQKTETDLQNLISNTELSSLLTQYPATQAALNAFLASAATLRAAIGSL